MVTKKRNQVLFLLYFSCHHHLKFVDETSALFFVEYFRVLKEKMLKYSKVHPHILKHHHSRAQERAAHFLSSSWVNR